jgi:hypothetical protein
MSTFEDRLWSQLVAEHDRLRAQGPPAEAKRTRRPGGRVLMTGTMIATAVAATAAVLTLGASTSTPPAYAVTTNSDGTVTVTLNDISAITGLNAELARDGLNARAVPLTADCPVHAPLVTMPAGTDPSTYTITLDPQDIPAGYTAVVAANQTASGRVDLLMGSIRPPVPTCFNSQAMPLRYIDPAHASPAMKAALARAHRAAQAAAKH